MAHEQAVRWCVTAVPLCQRVARAAKDRLRAQTHSFYGAGNLEKTLAVPALTKKFHEIADVGLSTEIRAKRIRRFGTRVGKDHVGYCG